MPVFHRSRSKPSTGPAKRKQTRLRYQHLCRIGTARSTLTATIVEVSTEGVRCEVPNGLMPAIGETVYFEWPDSSACFATAVGKNRTLVDLRFESLEPNFTEKLDTASQGFDSYIRVVALQKAWTASQS